MISEHYKRIKRNVILRFFDILKSADSGTAGRIRKLRLYLIENTFVDIWYSTDGSYSYHWEQRNIINAIYRHDNAPHKKWRNVSTFPKHCHDGNQLNVTENFLLDNYENAVMSWDSVDLDPVLSPTLSMSEENVLRFEVLDEHKWQAKLNAMLQV